MTQTVDQHLDFNYVAFLQRCLVQPIAAVDATAIEGSLTYVVGTDHHFHGHDGTSDQTVAWLSDLGIQIVEVTADPGAVPPEPYFQYNTANNEIKYSDGTALQQVWTEEQGKVVQQLAADPASAAANAGDVFYNTADGVIRYDDGTAIKTVATIDQISSMFRTRNPAFDASGATVPVAGDATVHVGEALAQGDVFFVGTAGTIVGIQGADALEVGDALVLVDAANPTLGASWWGLQTNLDLPANLPVFEEQTVNIVAATDLVVTAAVLANISTIEVYDNNNKKRPFMDLTITAATTATVNSLNAVTGARVYMNGTV